MSPYFDECREIGDLTLNPLPLPKSNFGESTVRDKFREKIGGMSLYGAINQLTSDWNRVHSYSNETFFPQAQD